MEEKLSGRSDSNWSWGGEAYRLQDPAAAAETALEGLDAR